MLLKLTTVVVMFFVWVPVASAWSWPVNGPVLEPFSYDEAHPYAAGQHRGIDIGATASGDPVASPESGTVSFAGFVPTSGESLTIQTTDGYSVTLTHLGSISVAAGAAVSEGDVVATVGPSGTPEQSVPYVHLGIRLTSDPLGYLDPSGFLPPPAPPAPAPTPKPVPHPVKQPALAPAHVPHGGGLVLETPTVAPPAVVAPVQPVHVSTPSSSPAPNSTPSPSPAPQVFRTDAPQIRRPTAEPVTDGVPVFLKPFAHAFATEPIALSIAPGIVALLLALATAYTWSRRQSPLAARVTGFRSGLPLRRAS
ncbi:MAG TPA: M23 family metallopeptidase [Gaiellaceae bacterium]|jgi:hypothetical protein